MEFGLFLNGYLPGPAAHNGEAEHTMLMRELEYAILADSCNWKYAWFGEHHALTEYSHMSAPEVVVPYVAARTERIHLGSAIINLSPPVNQPTRNAERRRHVGPRHRRSLRVRHRPRRRRARDADLRPPHLRDQGDVGRGGPGDRAHVGAARLPVRGQVVPRAGPAQHPPEALRRGAPPDLGGLRQPGHLHQGRRARHRCHRLQLRARLLNLKGSHRGLQGGCGRLHRAARAVRQRQRDDDQRRGLRGRREAGPRDRHVARARLPQHHGEPVPQHHAASARRGEVARRPAVDPHRGGARLRHRRRLPALRQPRPGARPDRQVPGGRHRPAGVRHPQRGVEHDEVLEMIELFGTKVIPEFDKDPVHRTAKMRATAKRKHPDFAHPLPEGLDVEVIPPTP